MYGADLFCFVVVGPSWCECSSDRVDSKILAGDESLLLELVSQLHGSPFVVLIVVSVLFHAANANECLRVDVLFLCAHDTHEILLRLLLRG